MHKLNPAIRFHSLDALRAWAMLLGIVLHAAWIMMAQYSGTPITDVDGGYAYDYIVHIIHLFRLQAFFLMAGFFAHLVFSRRGPWRFIWNRVSRIGFPLLAGWLLLYPIVIFQVTWGGMTSGRIVSDQGMWATFCTEIVASFQLNPSDFMHLWFLYDLLVVYAIALIVVFLFRNVLDRHGRIGNWLDATFESLVHSRWNFLVLAVPSGFILYFESFWWGVGGYPVNFVAPWQGILGYGLFFAFGWLLYAKWDLLAALAHRWRTNLAYGVALSIPLFIGWEYAGIHATPIYPLLEANHISVEHDLLTAAREPESSQPGSPRQLVLQSISTLHRQVLASSEQLSSDQKAGLAMELNAKVIMSDTFSGSVIWKDAKLPDEVQTMLADTSVQDDPAALLLLNRRLLESAFPGAILSDFTQQPYVALAKGGYSLGYAMAMWLLVMAAIGGFHTYFDHPSPTSRYLADSAYWVYIIHLPILFQIEVFVAHHQWGLGGIPKFLFYNVVATFFCFATYHYFVRSTFIGRILNGRTYPFVAWPGKRSAQPEYVGEGIPAPHVSLPDAAPGVAAERQTESSQVNV